MLKLKVLQAEFGDCLLLEFGTAAMPKCILVDGGPPTTYERHLRPELLGLANKELELVVLSHVDNDHIIGLEDLFAELEQQKAGGQALLVDVKQLWHNAFSQTIGKDNDVEARLKTMVATAGTTSLANAGSALLGVGEGSRLQGLATQLKIPVNKGFADSLILVDTAPAPIQISNLELTVVGPTKRNLEDLREEWLRWLDEHEDQAADPLIAANADRTTPNLSSIMLFIKGDNKTILLTGDGRSDHLLKGLEGAGLLDGDGRLYVDVLKLPHHGSDRNMTKAFFKKVTAATYVASANGKDGNPDLATLIWLVEAAKEQDRHPNILVTNSTPSVQKIMTEYPPQEYGYELIVMQGSAHSMDVDLA
jgi:hypothetical protein